MELSTNTTKQCIKHDIVHDMVHILYRCIYNQKSYFCCLKQLIWFHAWFHQKGLHLYQKQGSLWRKLVPYFEEGYMISILLGEFCGGPFSFINHQMLKYHDLVWQNICHVIALDQRKKFSEG